MARSSSSATWWRAPFVGLLLFLELAHVATPALTSAAAADDAVETLELIDEGTTTTYKLPQSMVTLTDSTFEGYLFPAKRTTSRAFFAVLYSPWCPHCKALLPQFINASRQLDVLGVPHSYFAVGDVEKNSRMTEFFQVHHYPTLVYTTAKGKQWHYYEGGNTMESFMQFSAYLQRALEIGSFSEDVTDVARFEEVEAKSGASRVPCYVYVPRSSPSTPENQRTAAWGQAIDGAASISNIRFSVIYEAVQAADWQEHASAPYKAVVEAGKACVAAGRANGPGGEALLVYSDRFRIPKCYDGAWVEGAKSGAAATAHAALSSDLEYFLALHGFHAVEDASSAMFDTLAKMPKNYLGVVMTATPIDRTDTNFVPVLRGITQAANDALEQAHGGSLSVEEELHAPRVSWSYIDAVSFEVWQSHYDVKVEELPAVLIIDTKRDRFYKMRKYVPHFESIKLDTPWQPGGEQQQLIDKFAQDVLADVYKAQKLSVAGAVAEFLSHYPGFSLMYELLGYEDFVFDIVVMVLCFFCFLLFLGLVIEPMTERQEEKRRKQQPKVKTD